MKYAHKLNVLYQNSIKFFSGQSLLPGTVGGSKGTPYELDTALIRNAKISEKGQDKK